MAFHLERRRRVEIQCLAGMRPRISMRKGTGTEMTLAFMEIII